MTQPNQGKRKPTDTAQATATSALLAQAQAAKTLADLQAVLVELVKRLGL